MLLNYCRCPLRSLSRNQGLLFLLVLFLSKASVAQSLYKLENHYSLSNSGASISDVVEDSVGSLYVTGFARGSGIYNSNPPISLSAGEIFILKIDTSGVISWLKHLGGNGFNVGKSIAIGPDGNIVVGGYVRGSITRTNIAQLTNHPVAGQNDNFILKLDPLGNFVWFKIFEGSEVVYNEHCFGHLAIGQKGDIYAVGSFAGRVDFNPGPDSAFGYATGNFHSDIFIVKLDQNGNLRWFKNIGAKFRDYGMGLALDGNENVIVGGSFSDTVDFDPGSALGILETSPPFKLPGVNPLEDAFIAKYDSTGSFVWAKQYGSRWQDRLRSLKTDSFGNIYTAGQFSDTADMDPGMSIYPLVATGGSGHDGYLQKSDPQGDLIWAKALGGRGSTDQLESIAVSRSGNVLVTGAFVDSVAFDPDNGNYYYGDTSDPFTLTGLIEFDGNGQFIWAQPLKANYAIGNGTGYNQDDQPYIFGRFSGSLDLDPTMKGDFIVNSAVTNAYFYQLEQCTASVINIADTVCGHFTFRDSVFRTTGDHTYPFLSQLGCDSLITFQLIVDSIDGGVSYKDSTTLQANDTTAKYRWYNCTKGVYLPNDTSREFTPPDSSSYAVLVKKGVCEVLSECLSLKDVSIPDWNFSRFELFPNPVQDYLVISDLTKESDTYNIVLYTLSGTPLIDFGDFEVFSEVRLDFREIPSGAYLLCLTKKGMPEYYQVIKN